MFTVLLTCRKNSIREAKNSSPIYALIVTKNWEAKNWENFF